MTDQPLPLDPIWRQAALEVVATFAYGDIIPHAWLYEHLAIAEPVGLMSADEYRALAFDLLRKVDALRDELLLQHQRYLMSVRSIGYKIIEPPQQTMAAMGRFQKELRRSLGQAMTALVHVNTTLLNLDDARENAEAKAKLAIFRTIHLKQLERPTEPPASELSADHPDSHDD